MVIRDMIRFGVLYSVIVAGIVGISMGFMPAQAQAQDGRIEGVIQDSQTGEPLPGASVLIEGTNKGSAADMDGKYVIRNVPGGEHVLVVSYVGYQQKKVQVTLETGQTLEKDLKLVPVGVKGEEVVISAQAQGQREAINEQLQSETISNVVSEARIQELPDANAAESVGRLPGVSIIRSGGEATKIAIRGLSPKFNTITVNGVRLPSTSQGDRSVDMSMVSSNMLSGIEVNKSIMPDQDADAIGGTVDLRLNTAPKDFSGNISAQGGYTRLQEEYGNYKFVGRVSDRFFNDKMGIIVGGNVEQYDRSADKFNAGYDVRKQGDNLVPVPTSLNLNEENVTRSRSGANIVVDYDLPNGEIIANGFYSHVGNDNTTRSNNPILDGERQRFSTSLSENTKEVYTGAVNVENTFFERLEFDANLSYTNSQNDVPENLYWDFMNEGAGDFSDVELTELAPEDFADHFRQSIDSTYFNGTNITSSNSSEEEWASQANFRLNFRINDNFKGYVKTGAKYRRKTRSFDKFSENRGLFYGGDQNVRDTIATSMSDLGLEEDMSQFPLSYFASDYNRDNFLNGDFNLHYAMNVDDLKRVTKIIRPYMSPGGWNTHGQDYSGTEDYIAGYLMSSIDLGPWITFIPGVRYEHAETEYDAKFVIGQNLGVENAEDIPYRDTTATRQNDFFLPNFHLQIDPAEWVKLRLAYTESISRPGYSQYAPNTYIDPFGNWINAPNTKLDPSRSQNFDASVQFRQNTLGFLTVSAFHKRIHDLIWGVSIPPVEGQTILPDLELPEDRINGNPPVNTSINNENLATYTGFEIEWQTHFWYLPSFLSGLILNVNYTRIESETDYPRLFRERTYIGPPPPLHEFEMKDTTYTGRMPDQPNNIANVTLGYDYKGFSARISMLYQGNTTASVGNRRDQFAFTDDYLRFDASVQQELPYELKLFANFNNINARPDRNYRAELDKYPTYKEYYGFTMDLGLRYNF